ncbi:MAG: ribonuclease D [Candidatus Helarchaeota archaeon]
MQSTCVDGKNVSVQISDLSVDDLKLAKKLGEVGWDIETTGLEWETASIGTCQLSIGEERIRVVKINQCRPENLCKLLSDNCIKKVFHHATFDLRFMAYKWRVNACNVSCTKIASKLLNPNSKNHSLKSLLQEYLGIYINKNERLSNWLSDELTVEQVTYAARDVMYLIPLLIELEKKLKAKKLLALEKACFAHIPTRVQLDIGRYGDIYEY